MKKIVLSGCNVNSDGGSCFSTKEKKIFVILVLILAFIFISKANASINEGVCKGCHGQDYSKKALNASKVVSEMTKDEVADALIGYKKGTYGGPMKGVMVGQIAKYSVEQLRNTGIGTGKLTTVKQKENVDSKKVLFSLGDKFAYVDGKVCWVVDYKNKKTSLADCKNLESRKTLHDKGLTPPTMGDMPNPLFDGLFK